VKLVNFDAELVNGAAVFGCGKGPQDKATAELVNSITEKVCAREAFAM